MQEPDHIQGNRTVVYLHGKERPEKEGPGGDRKGGVDTSVGEGPNLRHDPEPARLVYLEAEGLGSTHHDLLLRFLQRNPGR